MLDVRINQSEEVLALSGCAISKEIILPGKETKAAGEKFINKCVINFPS